jgi:hypothetical protein
VTVYVDKMQFFSNERVKGRAKRFGNWWCHMWADTEDELHQMADAIGLKRSWVQSHHAHFVHYDLIERRRRDAVALGAVEKSLKEYLKERKKKGK